MSKLAVKGGKPVLKNGIKSSWPLWDEEEEKALIKTLNSGKWGYPSGEITPEFENNFAVYHDAEYGIAFNSGTSALVAALWAVGVKPGDEVIVPAYTFIASVSAIFMLGAAPVFADVESDTFHLDPNVIEGCITQKTRAVLTVHIGGRPSDMVRLREVCVRNDLKLIEDAAQAWGAEWEHERVGALGDAGAFSFQSSKNITCGEGGIVLTNDSEIADYCRTYGNCGRIEGKPRYEHYYIGGNLRLGEFQAAVLMAQFKRYPELHQKRRDNAEYLKSLLADVEGLTSVNEDDLVTSSGYHFYLLRYDAEFFDHVTKYKFIEALNAEGIPLHPGYTQPLYKQPVFLNCTFGSRGEKVEDCPDYSKMFLPETESLCSEEGIWIPHKVFLSDKGIIESIAEAVKKVQVNIKELK